MAQPHSSDGTPGVITYRFDFQKTIAEAQLYIRVTAFHWSYSKGHAFIYGSRDGVNWVQLVEAAPPAYGSANTQVARSVPGSLLGGQSLWFQVELYSYGSGAPNGGVGTNTAQHSRYDRNADNTTFKLDVNFSNGPQRPQCAMYDAAANKIRLPCVIVGGNAYSLDLRLVSTIHQFFLELVWIDTFPISQISGDCAEFDAETSWLYIPCLNLDGEGFSAGLQLISIDPIRLSVQDVASTGTLSDSVLTDLYIHENSSDPLVASFADIAGKHYVIYGVKDSNHVPLYYDRLETFTMDENGFLNAYLTIEFDESGRSTVLRLPGNGGQLAIDYISSATARVTVTSQGTSESVDVANPYPEIQDLLTTRRDVRDGQPIEAYDVIKYVGDIIGDIIPCPTGAPSVTVRRDFDDALRMKYPVLAQSFAAKVTKGTYDNPEYYSYSYEIEIPGDDYDAWARRCKAGGFLNASAGFFGRIGDIAIALTSIFKDVNGGTMSESGKAVTNKIADTATGGVPIVSTVGNFSDAWEVEGSGKNGPCSESAYRFKRRRLLHEQEITVDAGAKFILKKKYKPTAYWGGSVIGFTQDAPTFDFSDQQCQPQQPPPPPECDPIALAVIISEDVCLAAGGYWWESHRTCYCPEWT